jgi:predicted metal-dependent peptidase
MNPKRKSYYAHFGCLLDTSGSMSTEDMAFGLSQLQSLDERSEGTITCGDAEIYWEQSTKIRKMSPDELNKVKVVGRGGTMFSSYFSDYEKHKEVGECDFLIVISDGYLMDTDIAEMKNPGKDVIWLITSDCDFKAPFGRVFQLRDC